MLSLLDLSRTSAHAMRRRTYFRSTPAALMVAKPLRSRLRKLCRWDFLLYALTTRYLQKLQEEMPSLRNRETPSRLLRNWSNLQTIAQRGWRWGGVAELSQNDSTM